MSGVVQNLEAVFTSSPQAVEVYQQGAWWPGSLLGWRQDGDGGCQMRVRVELGDTEETAWADLGALRLPEPPAGRENLDERRLAPPGRVRMPPAGGKRRAPEAAAPSGSGPAGGVAPGRHRAPSTAAAAAAGRHRAADTGHLRLGRPAAHEADRHPVTADRTETPVRTNLPPAGPVVRPRSVLHAPGQDCLTRPMRLDEDSVPARRSPRGALSGV